MINKNVLYIGSDADGSTSKSRYVALKQKIKKVSLLKINDRAKLSYKLKYKFGIDTNENLNKKLLNLEDKYDLIWLDKPTYIKKFVLEKIKKQTSTLVCHITDDLENTNHNWAQFKKSLIFYDYIFTCNKFNIKSFSNYNFYYNELGYDHEDYTFNPKDIEIKSKHNLISFFGHYEKSYLKKIIKISKNIPKNISINIGGQGWWKAIYSLKKNGIKTKFGWVKKQKMINEYRRSIACIGLYSEINRNLTSGRIFEMAALGLPIISEPNYILDELLENNYLVLNDNHNELNEHLLNENYLNFIRKNAYEIIKSKKCSWSDRVNDCLEIIGYE